MSEIIKTNDLSFYNDQGVITLSAKQYDTGRKFVFNIVNDGEIFDLSGYDASLRILKADGKQFQGEECCYIENNQVIIDTSIGNGNQILTSVGNNTCEIQLKDFDDKCITTWDFNINVHGKVHDGSNIISEDSWDNLSQVQNVIVDITDIKNKIDSHYFLLSDDKGVANGVAELDNNGKVPLSQVYSTNEIWSNVEPTESQRINDYLIIEY